MGQKGNIMNLNQFKIFMQAIKDYYEREEQLSIALEPFNSSYTVIEFCPSIVSSVLNYLKDSFNDKDEWISYWIFELDYGTRTDIGVSYKNGDYIDLSSIDALYNFLIENQNENDNK